MAPRLLALRTPPEHMPDALRSAWDAGDTVLPLPWEASDVAVERIVGALRPTTVVGVEGHQAVPPDGVSPAGDDRSQALSPDAALVVATSGSTGTPKGVVLTHRALQASTSASLARLGAGAGDRFTLALPVHHVAGLQILLRSWACGTEAEILSGSGPDAVAAATGDHLSLVPTQLTRLLDAEVDLRRWNTILLGGARAGPTLLARAESAGATVITSYGMTETCGGCVYDGVPLDGVDATVRDDGRIRLRGPVLFSGYLDDPTATTAAFEDSGWFVTGDRGELRDGRLEVLGRADDVVISGGENVPASVVAETMRRHARVADAAVIGVPDAEWGEAVVAVVVAADPATPPSLAELRAGVRAELPAAFQPRRLVLVERLPRDAMGKVAVDELREVVADPANRLPGSARERHEQHGFGRRLR